jgi:hypothetical protein
MEFSLLQTFFALARVRKISDFLNKKMKIYVEKTSWQRREKMPVLRAAGGGSDDGRSDGPLPGCPFTERIRSFFGEK